MRKKYILLIASLAFLITFVTVFGVISSYDSITGYATVEESISLDIIGSSNDENYTLKDVHQGETKWSPKIKIKNHADVTLSVNMTVILLPGSAGDNEVDLSIWDEDKNETLENPLNVTPDDLYIYIKHYFWPNATPGNYTFGISAVPS